MSWTRDEEARIHPRDKPFCRRLPTCTQRLWPKFDKYLRGRDLDADLARKNLWFPSRDVDGYDRLVVPGTAGEPGNLYWQARLLPGQDASGPAPRRWESPHGCARGDALCLVWPRENRDRTRSAIVEGPMDALAAAGEGLVAVALMGVQPAYDVLLLTARLLRGTIPVIVMDQGAEREMAGNYTRLAELGLRGELVSPYPHKDLAAMDRLARREVLGL